MSYTSPYSGTHISGTNTKLSLESAQALNGKSFALKEVTGDYDINTNPTGFGSPNIQRFEIGPVTTNTGIVIEVQRPEDSTFTYGIDVPATFVTSPLASDHEFVINPQDIGYSAGSIIPDGVYIIRYIVEENVNFNNFIQPAVKYVLLAHNAKCKVYNTLADVSAKNCCDDDVTKNALSMFSMYKSMLYNATMGNIDKVNNLLDCINNNNCECGC
jgi:hypothetical protein